VLTPLQQRLLEIVSRLPDAEGLALATGAGDVPAPTAGQPRCGPGRCRARGAARGGAATGSARSAISGVTGCCARVRFRRAARLTRGRRVGGRGGEVPTPPAPSPARGSRRRACRWTGWCPRGSQGLAAGAQAGSHRTRTTPRRALGLEAAVVDRARMPIRSLEPEDVREGTAFVAGPAALLVAKLHQLGSVARPSCPLTDAPVAVPRQPRTRSMCSSVRRAECCPGQRDPVGRDRAWPATAPVVFDRPELA
jgi:hypothetical protein